MRLTFGNPLPIEVRHLLDEIVILQQYWAVGPNGERELIAGDWNPASVVVDLRMRSFMIAPPSNIAAPCRHSAAQLRPANMAVCVNDCLLLS
jgi:hypothetical protein